MQQDTKVLQANLLNAFFVIVVVIRLDGSWTEDSVKSIIAYVMSFNRDSEEKSYCLTDGY